MENDLGPERPFIKKGPSPSDIHMNLIGNHVIDKDDFKLEVTKKAKIPVQRLVVKLSPTCTLYAETYHYSMHVTINEKILTSIYLKSYRAEDVALWLIRQKQHFEQYMEGWDAVLSQACKKAKSNRTVKRVAIEILEGPQENWITADEVSQLFPFFSKEWMKKYSYLLPRKRVEVMDKNGITTRSRWYYSRNRILRMVRENDILRFDDIIDRD
jgi:hypothetical protein